MNLLRTAAEEVPLARVTLASGHRGPNPGQAPTGPRWLVATKGPIRAGRTRGCQAHTGPCWPVAAEGRLWAGLAWVETAESLEVPQGWHCAERTVVRRQG